MPFFFKVFIFDKTYDFVCCIHQSIGYLQSNHLFPLPTVELTICITWIHEKDRCERRATIFLDEPNRIFCFARHLLNWSNDRDDDDDFVHSIACEQIERRTKCVLANGPFWLWHQVSQALRICPNICCTEFVVGKTCKIMRNKNKDHSSRIVL